MATGLLFFSLFFLVILSGFFSGSETGLMAVNRYRLQHLARKKHRAAQRVSGMLSRPERILSVILIGNTFANVLASAIATMIAVRLLGEEGVVLATALLILVILIFAEITPKTLAALFPERVAFVVSLPLRVLQVVLYPFVCFSNCIARIFLGVFGIKVRGKHLEPLSRGELKSLLLGMGGKISSTHQAMLLSILDLEQVTVNDIMVPRHEIVGINLNDPWEQVLDKLMQAEYIRLLVYEGSMDDVRGFTHARKLSNLFAAGKLQKKTLLQLLDGPHYIPEATLLSAQLAHFRRHKYRIGLVVDEYGEVQGLVTLSDILEEIVGEFCTDLADSDKEIRRKPDGSYVVDGNIAIRDLNRATGWGFPVEGPNTLSGLIIEGLEIIPEGPVGLRINGYPVEVIHVEENRIVKAKVWPKLRQGS